MSLYSGYLMLFLGSIDAVGVFGRLSGRAIPSRVCHAQV